MSSNLNQKIADSLQQVAESYYRLVLLVGISGSGKTAFLRQVSATLNVPIINTNLVVSESLLELPISRRSQQLPELLNNFIREQEAPIILDNLEVLFDKTLELDPLRLLQGLSRNNTLITSWNGVYSQNILTYADSSHAEYRRYSKPDALIIDVADLSEANKKETIPA